LTKKRIRFIWRKKKKIEKKKLSTLDHHAPNGMVIIFSLVQQLHVILDNMNIKWSKNTFKKAKSIVTGKLNKKLQRNLYKVLR